MARPDYLDSLKPITIEPVESADEIKAAVLKLMAAPNIADKSWVTKQYDRYVQGNTILAQPEDSGMIRIDEATHLGIAISTDATARWSYLDPYNGVKLALLESCRNIATSGAKPLAITNCLNFGSPEDPGVMWTFAETVRGLADICLEMGLPVTGGNVSFYNQTGKVAILPTPVVGVLGVIQDVRTRTSMSYTESGLELFQLGNTDANFSGSEWAHLHGQIGDTAPTPDIDHETRLVKLLLSSQEYFAAAHDISNGGFAATISEMALKSDIGMKIDLPGEYIPGGVTAALFSETPGRVVIAVTPSKVAELQKLADDHCITMHKVGVTGGEALVINEATISLTELRAAFTETFPKLFG